MVKSIYDSINHPNQRVYNKTNEQSLQNEARCLESTFSPRNVEIASNYMSEMALSYTWTIGLLRFLFFFWRNERYYHGGIYWSFGMARTDELWYYHRVSLVSDQSFADNVQWYIVHYTCCFLFLWFTCFLLMMWSGLSALDLSSLEIVDLISRRHTP